MHTYIILSHVDHDLHGKHSQLVPTEVKIDPAYMKHGVGPSQSSPGGYMDIFTSNFDTYNDLEYSLKLTLPNNLEFKTQLNYEHNDFIRSLRKGVSCIRQITLTLSRAPGDYIDKLPMCHP